MPHLKIVINGLLFWVLLYTHTSYSETAPPACKFDNLVFSSHFSGARMDACSQLSRNHFLIKTSPENEPINPSPWYAFAVQSLTGEQTITVSIEAHNARPRYLPKISVDKDKWTPLPFSIEQGRLVFSLDVTEQTQFISAQELVTQEDYYYWNSNIAAAGNFYLQTLGHSAQNRPIQGLIHQQTDNKEWFVIVGRQHPPEVTGALALFGFVESMVANTNFNAFLERFNVLIVPLVNPDGVALGQWRHSTKGIDLNRDWGKFTQVETQVVHNAMRKLMGKEGHLVFALDFHSTQQDIFYTMPTDYGVVPANFVVEWLDDVKKARVGSFTVRDRPGSSPGRGVFKQFIADEYGVHAVTYEVGDNTARPLIKHIAQVSADTLITKMLATPADAFIKPDVDEQ